MSIFNNINNVNYNEYNVYWDSNTATAGPSYTWRHFCDPKDILKVIRDYLARAETVDDFIQLIDRLDFLHKTYEMKNSLTLEEIEEVLGLPFREFIFFKKGLMKNLSQLREYKKREEGYEPALDNKLFEVE
jgi:hypothetical protein